MAQTRTRKPKSPATLKSFDPRTGEKLSARALRPQKLGLGRPLIPRLLGGTSSRIEWRPFGVVGAITPWNYPITNCFLAFAPALFAGNVVVVKPSEVTP